ncbi:MAG: response regulator [Gammaproteobacteria bacterium]|nr:response regulator [Gammaproteobacteria bacterium]
MLDKNGRPITIVVADDDPDDRMMIEEAFEENRLKNNLAFVEDGEQLIDYLRGEGAYTETDRRNPVGVILLDLNMPRMDGREALKIIKSDPQLQRIPVVVLTTSKAEEDILRTYDLGVSSFITKPVTFDALVEVVKVLGQYWFEIVALPSDFAA